MSLKYNISYEVASTIFLIILLCFIRLQYDTHSRLNKEFRKLTLLGLITTILDVTTAVTISYASIVPIEVNILLNTLQVLEDRFESVLFWHSTQPHGHTYLWLAY